MKKRPNPATAHTQSRQRGAETTSRSSALVRGQSTQFKANPCRWPQRPCPETRLHFCHFPAVSDKYANMRASTSATFNQDRTEFLNIHHLLGHISIKRARLPNIDGIPQPPSKKMPKVKCPVCIASKATRHKRPSATTADTRSASGPWQDIYSDLSGKMRISSICGYR